MSKTSSHSNLNKENAHIEEMFDKVSGRYDFLNRVLSLGIDRSWRKKLVGMMEVGKNSSLLDVACGSGDILVMAAEKYNDMQIGGLDLSGNMLKLADEKVKKKNLPNKVDFYQAAAENLPFSDESFDVTTCGFGVRNFGDLNKGLSEMKRVLKPGGQCLILEFSKPTRFPFAQIYHSYFKYVLPMIGKLISADKGAYKYLFESAVAFPSGEDFCQILKETGFREVKFRPLTFGICCIYSARK